MKGFRGLLGCLAVIAGIGTAVAAGDLAGKPTRLPDLVLGNDDTGFGMSQKEYSLETGKAYRLKIISTGKHEYAVVADDLFDTIWLRKVEAGGMEIKANRLTELEFEKAAQAEIFFVPIRPGNFRMRVKGLDSKGMVVTFTIK